jgi:ABC-type phosphate/phosphonate transport system permease subunit
MDTNNIDPSPELFAKIMKRIRREERFLVLRHAVIFSATLLVSGAAFVPVFKMLSSDFAQSGFFNFFSLVFSDFSVVISYWQNFALILLETLPVISLALFLAVLITFLQSLKSLTKDIKIIKYGYK